MARAYVERHTSYHLSFLSTVYARRCDGHCLSANVMDGKRPDTHRPEVSVRLDIIEVQSSQRSRLGRGKSQYRSVIGRPHLLVGLLQYVRHGLIDHSHFGLHGVLQLSAGDTSVDPYELDVRTRALGHSFESLFLGRRASRTLCDAMQPLSIPPPEPCHHRKGPTFIPPAVSGESGLSRKPV